MNTIKRASYCSKCLRDEVYRYDLCADCFDKEKKCIECGSMEFDATTELCEECEYWADMERLNLKD